MQNLYYLGSAEEHLNCDNLLFVFHPLTMELNVDVLDLSLKLVLGLIRGIGRRVTVEDVTCVYVYMKKREFSEDKKTEGTRWRNG